MASDDETELMGELLTRGATMLGEHCGECGNPLFRLRGEKLCAVCDRGEAVERKREVEEDVGMEEENEGSRGTQDEGVASGSSGVRDDLRVLAARLAGEAREEDDLRRLRERLEALETTLDLLERL